MSNLKKSIKEQNSDKLKELKEVSRKTKREKTKNFVGCAFNKVASLFVGKARVEYQSFLNLHDETKIGKAKRKNRQILLYSRTSTSPPSNISLVKLRDT